MSNKNYENTKFTYRNIDKIDDMPETIEEVVSIFERGNDNQIIKLLALCQKEPFSEIANLVLDVCDYMEDNPEHAVYGLPTLFKKTILYYRNESKLESDLDKPFDNSLDDLNI
ncbi:hypothetical protein DEFDS_P074 (plasmid) [Deferribacter desulfuricans SSM1]|uniref:Uncharacterized protein n=1 Tax=Deferribacter desulfuricans (strain DSM 14783 / JCM 11476 / NBRC 101012 / SSM1) TaxID=639282 RepID=D3PEQ6_DEFDS|nr:hypothetical protein [Deferribacter desulfuricans]BAI81698.1 hypothetical protein DEFDS_P074 [Deferribacter desulfuricans SSM1]